MLWSFDPAHSQIQFSVKHLGISTVRGTFDSFEGSIEEENGQVREVTVDVDLSSVNTGNGQRDGHLKSADFFDVENYPKATFRLTNFTRSGDDITATGELTLHGVTAPVTLKGEIGGPSKDPWGNEKVAASLTTKISRKDWGLVYNAALEAGGVLISDDVKLSIEVQAMAAALA